MDQFGKQLNIMVDKCLMTVPIVMIHMERYPAHYIIQKEKEGTVIAFILL